MRILVSGGTKTLSRVVAERREYLGRLTSPQAGNSVAGLVAWGLPWAADNGAFAGFDAEAFRRMLCRIAGKDGLLWVACPDAVGDARETLGLFKRWLPEMLSAGVSVAFVGQDGQEDLEVPWGDFGCWFIGGSTQWKLSQTSADLAAEAKRRGKWVHMGRVNSYRRMRAALNFGCDSVDGGQFSRFGDAKLRRGLEWLAAETANRKAQPCLFRSRS